MNDKKELIRRAAIKVMAREGYFNTRPAEIAEAAGIAVGTIYNYFSSKDEILEYIFSIEFEKRIKLLRGIREKGDNLWDRLELFLTGHFQEIKDNLDVGKILVREKGSSRQKDNAAINSYLNKIPEGLQGLLDEAVERGEIRGCDTRIAAAMVFGAIQGVVEKAINSNDFAILEAAPKEILQSLEKGLK